MAHREKHSLTKKQNGTGGNNGANKGKKLASRKLEKCPHCNKEGGQGNMQRFHFDNCKLRK